MKYSILIHWSEEDKTYIASLPNWRKYTQTYGETYEEVLENAQEVLEDLVYAYEEMGKPQPKLQKLQLM